MLAPLLSKGDTVRVIAPARSLMLPFISDELKTLAHKRLESLGLVVTFGKHVNERDMFDSSSIEQRLEDLHDAFADPDVKLILTVIGGFNSNQLLRHLDYELIQNNPKRLCGFSDITALANAIYAKTGLVTYSGPHFFNFGQKHGFEFTEDAFIRCHVASEPFEIPMSTQYIDGYWATNQDQPDYITNDGLHVLNEGKATGTIIGGNLCTLNLLHGTEFMPSPTGDIILFLEDDNESLPHTFDRDLQSLLHLPLAQQIKGVIVGRFEKASEMSPEKLSAIFSSKSELKGIPVIADVDFGHTTPLITLPIGGKAIINAAREKPSIEIIEH